MNLEPRDFSVDPYNYGPPCQTKGCQHEWFEHEFGEGGEAGPYGPCDYCDCQKYREEPLERDEAEPYDY